uniref:Uncharacterized protein n=1 Tax=Anguilla anguilla TaxID=7936 RepID=A0A0E9U3H5_ANGAN
MESGVAMPLGFFSSTLIINERESICSGHGCTSDPHSIGSSSSNYSIARQVLTVALIPKAA